MPFQCLQQPALLQPFPLCRPVEKIRMPVHAAFVFFPPRGGWEALFFHPRSGKLLLTVKLPAAFDQRGHPKHMSCSSSRLLLWAKLAFSCKSDLGPTYLFYHFFPMVRKSQASVEMKCPLIKSGLQKLCFLPACVKICIVLIQCTYIVYTLYRERIYDIYVL